MGKYQREKGKRGERLWRDVLRDAGFSTAYRTQQFSGKSPCGSADVNCPELPDLHFEVKNVEKLNVWAAYDQAVADAPEGKVPVVAITKNNRGFICVVGGEDLMEILSESSLVQSDD